MRYILLYRRQQMLPKNQQSSPVPRNPKNTEEQLQPQMAPHQHVLPPIHQSQPSLPRRPQHEDLREHWLRRFRRPPMQLQPHIESERKMHV